MDTLSNIIEFIPFKLFLVWLPQILRLANMEKIHPPKDQKEHMYKILEKISIYNPQSMYFTLKQFYKAEEIKAVKDVFLNIKKIYYNLITKLEHFAQLLI